MSDEWGINKLINAMRNRRAIRYATKLFLVLIIGSALLGSLSLPAQAQEESIDLVPGIVVSTDSPVVDDIMPCQGGIWTVTLHNVSDADGSLPSG